MFSLSGGWLLRLCRCTSGLHKDARVDFFEGWRGDVSGFKMENAEKSTIRVEALFLKPEDNPLGEEIAY